MSRHVFMVIISHEKLYNNKKKLIRDGPILAISCFTHPVRAPLELPVIPF